MTDTIKRLLNSTNTEDIIIGLRLLKPECKDWLHMDRKISNYHLFTGTEYIWSYKGRSRNNPICAKTDLDDIPFKIN